MAQQLQLLSIWLYLEQHLKNKIQKCTHTRTHTHIELIQFANFLSSLQLNQFNQRRMQIRRTRR